MILYLQQAATGGVLPNTFDDVPGDEGGFMLGSPQVYRFNIRLIVHSDRLVECPQNSLNIQRFVNALERFSLTSE